MTTTKNCKLTVKVYAPQVSVRRFMTSALLLLLADVIMSKQDLRQLSLVALAQHADSMIDQSQTSWHTTAYRTHLRYYVQLRAIGTSSERCKCSKYVSGQSSPVERILEQTMLTSRSSVESSCCCGERQVLRLHQSRDAAGMTWKRSKN